MSTTLPTAFNKTTGIISTGSKTTTKTTWSSGIGNTQVEINTNASVKDLGTLTTEEAKVNTSTTIVNTSWTVDYKSKLAPTSCHGVKIGIAVSKSYWPAFFDILAWDAIHEADPFFQIVCVAFLNDSSQTCPTTFEFSNYLSKSLARMQQDFAQKSSTKGYTYVPPTSDTNGKFSGQATNNKDVPVLNITGNNLSALANYGANLFIQLTAIDAFSKDSSGKMKEFPRIMNFTNSLATSSDYFLIIPDTTIKKKWVTNLCYKFGLASPLCCLAHWIDTTNKYVLATDATLPIGPGRILNIRNNNIDLNSEISNNYDPLFVTASTDLKAANFIFPSMRGHISCINIKSTTSSLKTSAADSLWFFLEDTAPLEELLNKDFIKKAGLTNTADSVIQIYSPINTTEYKYADKTYYLCELNYAVNYTRYYPYALAACIYSVNEYAKKQTTTN